MIKRMTSRERVLTTIGGGAADRVPVNYLANSGIDGRLKQHFGLAEADTEGLRRALGVDFRGVGASYVGAKLHDEVPDRRVDIWGIRRRWVEHGSGGYWDFCDFPLRDADEETVAAWSLPSPDDFDYSVIPEACRNCGDHAISTGGPGLGDIINGNGFLRGMEQTLIDLITDDPAGLRLAARRTAINLEVTRRVIEAAEGRIDFLWMGEDLGTQKAPIISRELYQRHIQPLHQKFIDLAYAHDLPVMIHTCGSSSWVYEDFIKMGISAVDTLQPEARDMSPAYLKDRFGGRLAFHGCISTAGAVTNGSPDDVARDCRQTLETMMPDGGYCFSPTHALQDNSPTENVLAMYETVQACGKY